MLKKFSDLVYTNKKYATAIVVGALAAAASLGYVVPPWVSVVLTSLGML